MVEANLSSTLEHITFHRKVSCDALLNNLCEVFNRQLVDGRDKPIIIALEFIRQYLMKRMAKVYKLIMMLMGPLHQQPQRC